MRILDNNTYRDMTAEEIEELFSDIQLPELDNKDNGSNNGFFAYFHIVSS